MPKKASSTSHRPSVQHPTGDKASQAKLHKNMNSVASQLAGVIEGLRSQMNQLDAGARACPALPAPPAPHPAAGVAAGGPLLLGRQG